MPKQPQDHQRKAAKRVQQEATDPMDGFFGSKITVRGRLGEVTVTVLDDPMEFEDSVDVILAGWQRAGGVVIGEVISMLKGIVSLEDARAIDAIRPTRGSAVEIANLLTDDGSGQSPEDELGEAEAS